MFHQAKVLWTNEQKEQIIQELQALNKPVSQRELIDCVIMLDLWCNGKDPLVKTTQYVTALADYLKKADLSSLSQEYKDQLRVLLDDSVPAFIHRIGAENGNAALKF